MQDSIVLYPAPGMGHIVSMVELGKLILRHYNHQFPITILLITADLSDPPTVDIFVRNVTQAHPLISFRRLPHIPVDTNPVRSPAAMTFERIRLNAGHALHSLEEISRTSNIRAFVIDLFCSSALPVGKGLKIPTYYFFTSGAACLSAFLYFPKVHEQQYPKSFKDLPDTDLHFPGMTKPLRAIHMPEPSLEKDDPSYHDFLYFCTQLQKADGILVNTFEDLEPMAIKTIADGACVPDAPTPPPTYYIGPLIAAGGENKGDQHDDCISWLDKQPSKSVVFLCFGSRGSFTAEQVKEIAKGLERSGKRFLWVVKNPPFDEETKQTTDMSDFDLDEILPEGFLERVKDRGLVVKSWAPQVAVLSHDSVGGFVTHCGWNSVLEAVVAGVPMVAWPLHAEQHLNRNLLVEDVKFVIAVEQRDDGFVKGDELERRIRELMESDRGREIRERSLQIRDMALAAWGMSGSSTRATAKLFETWKG